MNILERSFILADKICNHDRARNLKEDYYMVKQILLDMDWSLLYEAAKYEHGYLKIPLGLQIVKSNVNNESVLIKGSVERIMKCKEVEPLSQKMIEFKSIINELVYSVHSPKILEESILFTSTSIEREYRKFYSDFLRLNLIQYLMMYKSYPGIESAINKLDKIHKEIEFSFFWEERILDKINEVAKDSHEKKILVISNIFYTIMRLIEQVIFEHNFDNILFIDINSVKSYEIENGVMNKFTIEVNENLDEKDGWIAFLNDGIKNEVLLINTKKTSFKPNYKQILTGYIYPEDDSLYIKNFIKSIK